MKTKKSNSETTAISFTINITLFTKVKEFASEHSISQEAALNYLITKGLKQEAPLNLLKKETQPMKPYAYENSFVDSFKKVTGKSPITFLYNTELKSRQIEALVRFGQGFSVYETRDFGDSWSYLISYKDSSELPLEWKNI